MAKFLYKLDPSSKKYFCPECGKKRFVRYIHTETKEYHNDESFGRCDRQDSCGCFNKPSFNLNSQKTCYSARKVKRHFAPPPPQPISYVPFGLFARTRKRYEQNNFVQYLFTLAEAPFVNNRIEIYNIGTAKLPGATIFWLIDKSGNIRAGKVILYHPPGHERQGKRVKENGHDIYCTHSKKDNYFQCLFGEHLLDLFPSHPVALVESEKTAVIASIFYSNYIWLATGGKSGFTEDKCLPLKGRKVEVFPDLGCFDKWSEKAASLSHITQFQVSAFMELNATVEDRKKDPGMDIADFLVHYPSSSFNPKILIPAVLKGHSANYSSSEGLDASEPQEKDAQIAFNTLIKKYPSVKVLVERLNLQVKEVYHPFPPEDRKAMV